MAEVFCLVVLLAFLVVPSSSSDVLTFLSVGDWGGRGSYPYTTPAELKVASAMGKTADEMNSSFQLALGDNFYSSGVANVSDPRFQETFEKVFTADSLQSRWLVALGNHDHDGNASAQIAYTNVSSRWFIPNYYYSEVYPIGSSGSNLQLVVIDTVVLAGLTDPTDRSLPPAGCPNEELAEDQWTWIESTLAASNATWLLVAGHYPVWSIAEHGPTDVLVKRLKPLLEKYNVSAYVCGHDHSMQHIQPRENNVNYYVIGAGHLTDPSKKHMNDIPADSLQYVYDPWDALSEHGAYASVAVTPEEMTVVFYSATDPVKTLYQSVQKTHRN
eukprot:m.142693 g.142693  ORF g.142693 m.142693 type:complete len:329 (+) comp38366_c0_seq1:130-1116(+)